MGDIDRRCATIRLVHTVMLAVTTVAAVVATVVIVGFNIGFTPVLSDSMAPRYAVGSLVVTKPKATTSLAVGDVAILPIPDGSNARYMHRIITVHRSNGATLVQTRGDNNPTADHWTLRIDSDSVPVAIAQVPQVGYVNNVLREPAIRLGVALGVGGLTVFGMLRGFSRNRRYVTTSPAGR